MRHYSERSPRRLLRAYGHRASLSALERAARVGIPVACPQVAAAVARLLRRRSAFAAITQDEAAEITARLLEKEPGAFLAGLEQVESLRRSALAVAGPPAPIC